MIKGNTCKEEELHQCVGIFVSLKKTNLRKKKGVSVCRYVCMRKGNEGRTEYLLVNVYRST